MLVLTHLVSVKTQFATNLSGHCGFAPFVKEIGSSFILAFQACFWNWSSALCLLVILVQLLRGYIMAPLVWLMGIPWVEAFSAGSLMGIKTVLNEFIAYIELSILPAEALSELSRFIMVYAMCGFA